MSGATTQGSSPQPGTTPFTPVQPSFTYGADGNPVFWPQPGKTTPPDATPINPVELSLWAGNPNLRWNSALGLLLTPQPVVPIELFWSWFTQYERLAIAQSALTNALVALGLQHAQVLRYIDLTTEDAQTWLSLLLSLGALNATRYYFILSGTAPTADQLTVAANQLAALQASMTPPSGSAALPSSGASGSADAKVSGTGSSALPNETASASATDGAVASNAMPVNAASGGGTMSGAGT